MTSFLYHNAIMAGIKDASQALDKQDRAIEQIHTILKEMEADLKKKYPEIILSSSEVINKETTPSLVVRLNILDSLNSERTLSVLLRSNPGKKPMTLMRIYTNNDFDVHSLRVEKKHFMYTGKSKALPNALAYINKHAQKYGFQNDLMRTPLQMTTFSQVERELCACIHYMKKFAPGLNRPCITDNTTIKREALEQTMVIDTNIPAEEDQTIGIHITGNQSITASILGRNHADLSKPNEVLNVIKISPKRNQDGISKVIQYMAKAAATSHMIAAPK